jgi:hypothetical protein
VIERDPGNEYTPSLSPLAPPLARPVRLQPFGVRIVDCDHCQTGFAFPNGRLISGNLVFGDCRLVYCTCLPAVRGISSRPDGETLFHLRFDIPLDTPSGEYEVYVLPDGGSCPSGNAAGTGCFEDACAVGPLKLFVQPSDIVSVMEELMKYPR